MIPNHGQRLFGLFRKRLRHFFRWPRDRRLVTGTKCYSLHSKLLVAEIDVSKTKIHLDTSIHVTSNSERREYFGRTDGWLVCAYRSWCLRCMTELQTGSDRPGRVNYSLFVALVALIPKKDGAAKISEFRPIVLIHSIAKLMAKVLSMQLSCVIDTVILPVLSAFLAKKYTHNSFFYVQNRVRSLHRKKTSLLLLKLDIAKGFNNVSWKYLLELLQALHRKP